MRPDPDVPTDTPRPPTAPDRPVGDAVADPASGVEEATEPDKHGRLLHTDLLASCRITDPDAFAATVQGLRRDLGQPSVRWSAPCPLAAIGFAVTVRGWPQPTSARPCCSSLPTPSPAAPYAWPKQDPGGIRPNDPAGTRALENQGSSSAG